MCKVGGRVVWVGDGRGKKSMMHPFTIHGDSLQWQHTFDMHVTAALEDMPGTVCIGFTSSVCVVVASTMKNVLVYPETEGREASRNREAVHRIFVLYECIHADCMCNTLNVDKG